MNELVESLVKENEELKLKLNNIEDFYQGRINRLIKRFEDEKSNEIQELKNEIKNHDDFASCISRFKTNLNIHNRNLAIDEDIKHLDDLEIIAELGYHNSWMDIFTNKYIK